MGYLRYRQGRFEESADLHRRAAAGKEARAARLSATVNAASTLLEALRLEPARALAAEAQALAEDCRHAHFEARAAWILRNVAYRQGDALEPDLELLGAAAQLDLGYLDVLLCITEAAVAWRAGLHEIGRNAAARACQRAPAAGPGAPALPLARALSAVCGEPLSMTEAEELGALAVAGDAPRLALQTLALLALVHPVLAQRWQHSGAELARRSQLEERDRHVRLEVLSLNEALDALVVRPLKS